jgi:hypothetical protein
LTGWGLVCLILLGSLWGLSELMGGDTIWLTAVALFLLAVARALVNRPGSSTAMAGVAVLFKSVNTAPFFCHLVGIALLGVAFDLAATFLWGKVDRPHLRTILTGVSSAYLSCVLFSVTMVWLIEYQVWAGGGIERIAEYTLASGTRGALTALLVVPAGRWFGHKLGEEARGRPRPALYTTLGACLVLWVLGAFAG